MPFINLLCKMSLGNMQNQIKHSNYFLDCISYSKSNPSFKEVTVLRGQARTQARGKIGRSSQTPEPL